MYHTMEYYAIIKLVFRYINTYLHGNYQQYTDKWKKATYKREHDE